MKTGYSKYTPDGRLLWDVEQYTNGMNSHRVRGMISNYMLLVDKQNEQIICSDCNCLDSKEANDHLCTQLLEAENALRKFVRESQASRV